MKGNQTKIYTVFTSEGLFGSTQTYPLHHPEETVLKNQEILEKIKELTSEVEFLGRPEPENWEYVLGSIKGQQNNLDGILFFGTNPGPLLKIDLPVIAVFPLWGQWPPTYNSFSDNRVLTSCLPVIPDKSEEVFNQRLKDIARKINLIKTLSSIKDLRILIITDKPILGAYEPMDYQIGKEGREEYEKRYLRNLARLGGKVVIRPQSEMVSRMDTVSDKRAKQITEKWVEEAVEIKGTNKNEIKKSAKLYLVMKEMMKEYDTTAITTEGYGEFINYEDGPIPSQGLPSSQLSTEGIVATSETLLDSLITQYLGLNITGFAGFNGDYVIDENINKAYIGHCECPFNVFGDERKRPYTIRNLPQYSIGEQEKGGASVKVDLPAGEKVTVVKIGLNEQKMSLFTGESKKGAQLFPGWDDILCRTKLAINTRADLLLKNVNWKAFGNHRVAFFGDYRQDFKNLAKLMGLEVIEKDKI